MKSFLIAALWLLGAPFAVILILLATQGLGADVAPPAPPAEFTLPAQPAPREFRFQLLRADGSVPAGAVVLAFEPELVQGRIADDGAVTLPLRAAGPVRVMAWAPGCVVSEAGPWLTPPATAWLLAPLESPELTPASALILVDRDVRVTLPGGAPLAHALVSLRSAEDADAAPAFGFTDVEGALRLRAEAGDCQIEVFAPGHAALAPWRVAEVRAATAGGDPIRIEAACGNLQVNGLAPGEALELLREGDVVGRAVANAAGEARWTSLPLGDWQLRIETGEAMPVRVAAEGTTLLWQ